MVEAILALVGTVLPLAVMAYVQFQKESRDYAHKVAVIEANEIDAGLARIEHDGMHL